MAQPGHRFLPLPTGHREFPTSPGCQRDRGQSGQHLLDFFELPEASQVRSRMNSLDGRCRHSVCHQPEGSMGSITPRS